MLKLTKLVVASLLLSVLLFSCVSAPKAVVSTVITGDSAVDLSEAEIYGVTPTVVLPGTLMCITGAGFGSNAGVINIGGIDVTEYLGWADDVIWFRAPADLADDAEVQVGYEIAEAYISKAPEGSLTVEWTVDAAATQEVIDVRYTLYDLEEAPVMTSPLHVKGQWSKSEGTYGLKDEGWDGGSRLVMFNVPGTSNWIVEAVFTPEAIESFDGSMLSFAIEDGEDELRNLSSFESDFAFVLKKRWASSLGLSNDPALKISEENTAFDPTTRTIKIMYPQL